MLYLVRCRSSPHTRNLLKCCRSVISIIRYKCCCRTRRSCWMSTFSSLTRVTFRLWIAIPKRDYSFSDLGCNTVTTSGGVVIFSSVKINFLYNSRYRYWCCYGFAFTAPNRWIYARTKKRRKYINSCLRFFLSHLRVYSSQYFVKLPPFCNSYPGSYGTHFSSFLTTVRAFV